MGPNGGGSESFPDRDAAVQAVSALDPAQVTGDLNAAADYAKTVPAASGTMFVTGFCWGGP
jgi:carboxymethylenebutenolidase